MLDPNILPQLTYQLFNSKNGLLLSINKSVIFTRTTSPYDIPFQAPSIDLPAIQQQGL